MAFVILVYTVLCLHGAFYKFVLNQATTNYLLNNYKTTFCVAARDCKPSTTY